jgi:hypothetical protein
MLHERKVGMKKIMELSDDFVLNDCQYSNIVKTMLGRLKEKSTTNQEKSLITERLEQYLHTIQAKYSSYLTLNPI